MSSSAIAQHPLYKFTFTGSGSESASTSGSPPSSMSSSLVIDDRRPKVPSWGGKGGPIKNHHLDECYAVHQFIQDIDEDIVLMKGHVQEAHDKLIKVSEAHPDYEGLRDVHDALRRQLEGLYDRRRRWVAKIRRSMRERRAERDGEWVLV